MSYHRLEINLLPPEMQPAPPVRYGLVINTLIIVAGLALIVINLASNWFALRIEQNDNESLKRDITTRQQVVDDYNMLVAAKESIDGYGRVVARASLEYIDLPLLMDRLSSILPAGVYVDRISNDGMDRNPGITTVRVLLRAAENDHWLVLEALDAFKRDPIFNDCYMPDLQLEDLQTELLMQQAGITWDIEGSEFDQRTVQEFAFEIQARIKRPIRLEGTPVVADFNALVADFQVPYNSNDDGTADGASGAPAGVEVVGVE